MELLRGRDGLPGRDGPPGRNGEQGPAGPPGPRSGGAIYTRWGKSSCPQVEGTELVYSGITGGTPYNHNGGGSNYLCLPEHPRYSPTLTYRGQTDASDRYASRYTSKVYGSEYEFPLQGTHDHNVPCAVCHVSTRPTVMMIPAEYLCPSTWTREYYGYLMTESKGTSSDIRRRAMFECVDQDQESLRDSEGNTDGVVFYHTEAACAHGHLPCPPYDNNKELNCVVCTK